MENSKIQRELSSNPKKLEEYTFQLYKNRVGILVPNTVLVGKKNSKEDGRILYCLSNRTFPNGDTCVYVGATPKTLVSPIDPFSSGFWVNVRDVEIYGGDSPDNFWKQVLAKILFLDLEPDSRLFALQIEEQLQNLALYPRVQQAIEDVCTFRFGLPNGPKRQDPIDYICDQVRELLAPVKCPISPIEELLLVSDPSYKTPLAGIKEKTVSVEEEPLPLSFNEKSRKATNLFALMQEYCGTPAPQTPAKEKNANSDSVPVPRKPRKPNKTPGSISVIEDD